MTFQFINLNPTLTYNFSISILYICMQCVCFSQSSEHQTMFNLSGILFYVITLEIKVFIYRVLEIEYILLKLIVYSILALNGYLYSNLSLLLVNTLLGLEFSYALTYLFSVKLRLIKGVVNLGASFIFLLLCLLFNNDNTYINILEYLEFMHIPLYTFEYIGSNMSYITSYIPNSLLTPLYIFGIVLWVLFIIYLYKNYKNIYFKLLTFTIKCVFICIFLNSELYILNLCDISLQGTRFLSYRPDIWITLIYMNLTLFYLMLNILPLCNPIITKIKSYNTLPNFKLLFHGTIYYTIIYLNYEELIALTVYIGVIFINTPPGGGQGPWNDLMNRIGPGNQFPGGPGPSGPDPNLTLGAAQGGNNNDFYPYKKYLPHSLNPNNSISTPVSRAFSISELQYLQSMSKPIDVRVNSLYPVSDNRFLPSDKVYDYQSFSNNIYYLLHVCHVFEELDRAAQEAGKDVTRINSNYFIYDPEMGLFLNNYMKDKHLPTYVRNNMSNMSNGQFLGGCRTHTLALKRALSFDIVQKINNDEIIHH